MFQIVFLLPWALCLHCLVFDCSCSHQIYLFSVHVVNVLGQDMLECSNLHSKLLQHSHSLIYLGNRLSIKFSSVTRFSAWCMDTTTSIFVWLRRYFYTWNDIKSNSDASYTSARILSISVTCEIASHSWSRAYHFYINIADTLNLQNAVLAFFRNKKIRLLKFWIYFSVHSKCI